MENRELYIEELIAKRLAGEISGEENLVLNEWLEKDPANQKYFESLKTIYTESAAAETVYEVDTDAAWNKLKKQIAENKETKVKTLPGTIIQPAKSNSWLRIAAMLIVIAGAAITLYIIQMRHTPEERQYATFDAASLFTLPDSSTIYLNKNSRATVTIADNERKVVLHGEGFFNVVHNEKQPFILEASGLIIKDIGTAFNVNATDEKHVEVLVEHGEVELAAAGKKVNLKKGDYSVYDKSSSEITKTQILDPNTLSYTTKIFVFENTTLPAVIVKLHEVYGTEISLADNLKFCRLTSTFRNEKIENILQVIAETLQLQLNKKGSAYYFEGSSCTE